jgi:hypothetical protein
LPYSSWKIYKQKDNGLRKGVFKMTTENNAVLSGVRTKFCDAATLPSTPAQDEATREVMQPEIPRVEAEDLMHPYGLD